MSRGKGTIKDSWHHVKTAGKGPPAHPTPAPSSTKKPPRHRSKHSASRGKSEQAARSSPSPEASPSGASSDTASGSGLAQSIDPAPNPLVQDVMGAMAGWKEMEGVDWGEAGAVPQKTVLSRFQAKSSNFGVDHTPTVYPPKAPLSSCRSICSPSLSNPDIPIPSSVWGDGDLFSPINKFHIDVEKYQLEGSVGSQEPASVTPGEGLYTVNHQLLKLIREGSHEDNDIVKLALARWREDLWNHLVDPCDSLNMVDFMYCSPLDMGNSVVLHQLSAAGHNLTMAKIRMALKTHPLDLGKLGALVDKLPDSSQQLANETCMATNLQVAVDGMKEALSIMKEYSDSVMTNTMSRLSLLEQKTEVRLASIDASIMKLTSAFERIANLNLKDLSSALAGAASAGTLGHSVRMPSVRASYTPSLVSSRGSSPISIPPINRPPKME